MQYIKATRIADFKEGSCKSVRILGRHVAIIKEPDGTFRAIEAGCKHQNADLTSGTVEQGVVTCPWHGWKYDIQSGKCVWGSETRLRKYACMVDGDYVLISMHPVDSNDSDKGFVPFE